MTQGLILFAHGARDPRWARPFEDLAARVRRQRPGLTVRLAYLEFMTPDVAAAAAALVSEGCTRLSLVPVFLGSGGHVRKDLPQLVQNLHAQHPQLAITLHEALGEADRVLQAMADAALDAMASEAAA